MSTKIDFKRELKFEYGVVDQVSPGIRRVIAENPSPFTLYGTGTYIIGQGEVAVIDPGPADPAHIAAILKAVEGEQITHILVTHTHMDHSPGCRLLQQQTDAKTYAYGPHGAGKSEQVVVVEEGGDMEFDPDHKVVHGDILDVGALQVECVYTPGHTSNHMCFALMQERTLFTGDHVMGWSTSIISPPDGDMAAYMESLELLLARDDHVYWPTHGPAITAPHDHVRAFIQHRLDREAQILRCIDQDVHSIMEMVPIMYTDTPEFMYPAAARSVLAAIEYMVQKEVLRADSGLSLEGQFYRV